MADQFTKSFTGTKVSKTSHKHLLERHRRARINNSLNELKHLILSSLHHDHPQTYEEKASERMDKADVLDLTVEFLQDNKQAVNNGIRAERLSREYKNDSALYHRMPAPPLFVPYCYPRMDGEYLVFPSATHPLYNGWSIPPYLESPLASSDPPSPIQLSANQIDGKQQPMNESESSESKSTKKDVWRPW
ncbi:transcription factor HES-2-like isoform X2 [Actinia tenebrosa]|uniref:Transcription factor HES-2-like isoform X2 n=1 Tax=Actinia tenebrosa TaxID=6105 RepID=A0A6P8I4B4_ACTTE|nr:transcription factor HES-2-like isoform X2 [Actinia tenebrosa]